MKAYWVRVERETQMQPAEYEAWCEDCVFESPDKDDLDDDANADDYPLECDVCGATCSGEEDEEEYL